MSNNYLAQGILLYSTLYISSILTLITLLTGRWVFIFFILLSFGLLAYMSYLTAKDSAHLQNVGKWAEEVFANLYEKILAKI